MSKKELIAAIRELNPEAKGLSKLCKSRLESMLSALESEAEDRLMATLSLWADQADLDANGSEISEPEPEVEVMGHNPQGCPTPELLAHYPKGAAGMLSRATGVDLHVWCDGRDWILVHGKRVVKRVHRLDTWVREICARPADFRSYYGL
jgi:hypothetical protein